MPLKDLKELAEISKKKCSSYDHREIWLSESFKEEYRETLATGDALTFFDGTVLLRRATGLTITFPNQWFATASFFSAFLTALSEYKTAFDAIFPDLGGSELKKISDGSEPLNKDQMSRIEEYFESDHDRALFIRFLTDYDWWSGSRTVDRKDFYESSVLALAGVVNASQGYIAEIAQALAASPELVTKIEISLNRTAGPAVDPNIILSNVTIKNFIFDVFRFLEKEGILQPILELETKNADPKYRSVKFGEVSLTSIFWVFDQPAEVAQLSQGGDKIRTSQDSIFQRDGKYYYVSGEWTDGTGSRLDFTNFQFVFNSLYSGEMRIRKSGPKFELIRLCNHPLNQILYGPPGTGKTHNAITHAVAIVQGRSVESILAFEASDSNARKRLRVEYDNYVADGRIRFVTFHQSYSYEEFVEGIKMRIDKEVYDENESSNGKESKETIRYEVAKGVFRYACEAAAADKNNNYVLIIDEINRGNISRIFGELITAIEPSKRAGNDEEISIRLAYSGADGHAQFTAPKNLYIVGTMNSADRSIAIIDTALRRRFTFVEYPPQYEVLSNNVEGIDLKELLRVINQRIEILLDKDHMIGHAYFLGVESKNELCAVFRDRIIPLLEEYFYGDYDKIQLVLGDNYEWGKTEDRKFVRRDTQLDQRMIFGTEIDGFEEKYLYRLNKNLREERFDEIGIEMFTSVYVNSEPTK